LFSYIVRIKITKMATTNVGISHSVGGGGRRYRRSGGGGGGRFSFSVAVEEDFHFLR
jgi:hypothetical protein